MAVGRKNWNFCGSDESGNTAAVLKSIRATCKRLRVDASEYLPDVFQRISTYPQNNLDDLLSDKWEAAQTASTSNS
jgi:transposase